MPGPSDVFLIRHATAIDETLALRDPNRHLTADGRAQARALGDRLRWHDCEPTHLWSSPLVRAIQTAELVALTLGIATVIESLPELAPEGHPREVARRAAELPDDALVMLFGHEPTLSAVGALLTARRDFRRARQGRGRADPPRPLRWRFAWNAEAPQALSV